MAYIIDGHNLIPNFPWLDLSQPDDENALLEILNKFCTLFGQTIEVFFDKAAPGHGGRRQIGKVKVTFVPDHSSADQMIISRLNGLGRAARNWTVVTSDHRIQVEARTHHSKVISSEEFAAIIREKIHTKSQSLNKTSVTSSESDIQEWLELFSKKRDLED